MNSDFRLAVTYFAHSKIQKLGRRLGDSGVLAHIKLLSYAAQNRPTGALTNMDSDDIAIASGYGGDIAAFLAALGELRLLDTGEGGTLELHDWADHNPWAAGAEDRTNAGRKAAQARWDKEREKQEQEAAQADARKQQAQGGGAPPTPPAAPNGNAPTDAGDKSGNAKPCAPHQSALPAAPNGNAPFLSFPNPPIPNPPIPTTPNQPNPPTRAPEPPGPPPGDTEADLDAGCLGVLETILPFVADRAQGADLLRRYGCEMVRWQAAAMEWRLANPRGDGISDPASYFLTALRKQLPLPAAVNEERERQERLRKAERAQAEAQQRATAEHVKRAGQERLEAIWGDLPEDEQQSIEQVAKERLCETNVVFRTRSKKKPETWTDSPDARNALKLLRDALLVERGHVTASAGGES